MTLGPSLVANSTAYGAIFFEGVEVVPDVRRL
jgi:hypothetical protein